MQNTTILKNISRQFKTSYEFQKQTISYNHYKLIIRKLSTAQNGAKTSKLELLKFMNELFFEQSSKTKLDLF